MGAAVGGSRVVTPPGLSDVGAGVVAGGPYTLPLLVEADTLTRVSHGRAPAGDGRCGVVCRRRCYQKAMARMSTHGCK